MDGPSEILKDGWKIQGMKRYSNEVLNGKNISLKIVVISRIRVLDSSWKRLKIQCSAGVAL